MAKRKLRVQNLRNRERILGLLLETDARKVLPLTVNNSKSVAALSEELNLPQRSVYRYAVELCELGLLAPDKCVLLRTGGKYSMFKSMVKTVTLTYDVQGNSLEVDLIPNDSILDKFLRYWSMMGGQ